ncbi:MAG: hypothetical protein GX129_04425 [Clostridiales bacterium]|jgi:hypothetical protein|nr:hypothetical protein [Clostridiales bacterium]
MEKAFILAESKYVKSSKEETTFSFICTVFFITLYVLPQYFGIPLLFFDFTVLRVMMLIMFMFVLGIKQKQEEFLGLIVKAPYSMVLLPYIIVLVYTTILRVDVNAFLNPVIEILAYYLLVYIIQNYFGVKKTLRYILIFSYLITALGLVEYVMQRSPFSYLETIKGIYSGQFIRSGYYRIMGPSIHSLGYGLILITMIPIICYDIEKDEINILKHKLLFAMAAANIFFTGSRSTLSVFILEIILLVLFSSRINKKKLLLTGSIFVAGFAAFLLVFHNTSVAQYILLQITSVLDEIFGSTFSVAYGADIEALGSSSHYRSQLKYIFKVEWLNPLIGLGRKRSFACEINGSFIRSVDNFYIAEFIRYAYPGMICYIGFLLYFLIHMLKSSIQKKSQISKMLLVGSTCYCINLLWLDSLQTLKYLYVLFAIFCCLPSDSVLEHKKVNKKIPSKYIK